jgi:hypothetical protein
LLTIEVSRSTGFCIENSHLYPTMTYNGYGTNKLALTHEKCVVVKRRQGSKCDLIFISIEATDGTCARCRSST